MKKFSCKNFFHNAEKEKIFKKYFVDTTINPNPCEPDFEQCDEDSQYAPEEHLIEVHGFLINAPEKKRRTLEIELCKSIEVTLQDLHHNNV